MNRFRPGTRNIIIIVIMIMISLYVISFGWLSLQGGAKNTDDKQALGRSLIRIVGYKPAGEVACAAVMPSCGVCYGKIVEDECYATQKEFDAYKELYPGLEGEPVD